MERFNKKIKKRNYYILLGLIIITIAVAFGFTAINSVYQKHVLKKSPLFKVVNNTKYEEINKISKDDYFIMFSYNNDKDVNLLEKELANILKKNKLTDMFYYVDISNIKSDTLIDEINTTLNLSSLKIDSLPAIIYYKSNNPLNVISNPYGPTFSSGNFHQILDIYELVKK